MLSVNGKSGAVRLNALDVWALPRPVSPKVGQLVRVVKVDASTGALTIDTISTDSLSRLGSERASAQATGLCQLHRQQRQKCP